MALFSNILVGVDLSRGDWLASGVGESSSHFACEQAVELGKSTGAKLHFMATLDLDERTKRLLEENSGDDKTVVGMAEEALRNLAIEASKAGVPATSDVACGGTRTELVKRAKEAKHDLVIIGSRQHSLLSGLLLGSTSFELLRKSPCPVWVVKKHDSLPPKKIMAATDFSPVCDALVDIGAGIAELYGSQLHLLHVIQTRRRPFLSFSGLSTEEVKGEHQKQANEKREKINQLLERSAIAALSNPPTLHLLEGTASQRTLEQAKELDIDLLLMGTIAWGGVTGAMFGSTAQNLLPQVNCSLLTMRPDGLHQ